MRTVFSVLLGAALVTILFPIHSGVAAAPSGSPQIQRQEQNEPLDPSIEKKMAKARMQDRYKDLKRDSQKLLELATELKQYVDKSDENVLSMEVINKCDQIEKLAKSVRSKMKGN